MITKFALQEVCLVVKLFEVYWEAYLRDLLQTQFAHYIIEQTSCLLEYHLNDFKIRIGKKRKKKKLNTLFSLFYIYIFKKKKKKKVILHWCLVIVITIFITLIYNINIFIIPTLCDLEKLERKKNRFNDKKIYIIFSPQNHVSSYGHVLDFLIFIFLKN